MAPVFSLAAVAALICTVAALPSTAPIRRDGTGKCHIHLWEHWLCGADSSNLAAVLQLWDASGNELIAPTPSSDSPRHIDDGNPGVWDSSLPNSIVVTGEHQGDYVQFTVGSTSWTSKDHDSTASAYCNLGGWDPRQGPTCAIPGELGGPLEDSPSIRQMDCYFPC